MDPDWTQIGVNPYDGTNLRLKPPLLEFQLLFDVERQLDHAFRHLFRRQPNEVLKYQLFNIQSDEIAELEGAAARGKNEIAMAAVHDN